MFPIPNTPIVSTYNLTMNGVGTVFSPYYTLSAGGYFLDLPDLVSESAGFWVQDSNGDTVLYSGLNDGEPILLNIETAGDYRFVINGGDTNQTEVLNLYDAGVAPVDSYQHLLNDDYNSEYSRWNAQTKDPGFGTVIFYKFNEDSNLGAYSYGATQGGFLTFDEDHRDMARDVFAEAAAQFGVQFIEIDSNDTSVEVNILIHGSDDTTAGGFANYANAQGTLGGLTVKISAGDVGADNKATFLHELGHSLGLKHPFGTNGPNGVLADPLYDQQYFTVMSYTGPRETEFRQLDIEALNYLYGTNAEQTATYVFNGTSVTITGTAGDDKFAGSSLDDIIIGGDGNDIIFAATGDDVVNAGDGNDIIFGGNGADMLYGEAGNDTFLFDYNTVLFDGGTGTDVIDASGYNFYAYIYFYETAKYVNVENIIGSDYTAGDGDYLLGDDNDNNIKGLAGNDYLDGYGGNDRLYDGDGDDDVLGGDGDDYFRVGDGANNFNGEAGTDYINYYSSVGGITINLATNVISGSWAADDTIENFEGFGGSNTGGDYVVGTTGKNSIRTYGGDDTVYAGKGNDVVRLGDGDDYVRVGGGKEYFDGGEGVDTISYYKSSGGVTINLATNTATGSWAANDTVKNFENVYASKTGDDNITGTTEANYIKTYGGADKVYAGKGNDIVKLGDGDDYVRVGGGKEYFDGGSGVDTISYYKSTGGVTINLATNSATGSWAANDTVKNFENVYASKTGDDHITGTSGANYIKTYGGNDIVYAGGGDDLIKLGDGDDYVKAGGGVDTIYGGDGADRFDAGGGDDIIYGGSGADIFHYDFGEDHDTIMDFENNIDTIELDNSGYANVAEAMGFATQVGADVVFDFGSGDGLTIENATLSQLTNDLLLV